jgi:tetratricopeptide (TPR) repeat protein
MIVKLLNFRAMHMFRIYLLIFGMLFLGLSTYGETGTDYIQKGKSHLTEMDIEKAIHSFSKAIEKEQNVAEALLERAQAYLFSGDCEKASEDYEKAFKIAPDFVKKQLGINNSEPDPHPTAVDFSKPDYYD